VTTRPDRNRYIFAILLGLSFLIFAYVITRPNAETRAVVGERFAIDYPDVDRKVTYYVAGSGTNILLYGGTGREVSDLNELVIDLNEAGYRTLTIGTPGISTHPPEDLNLSSYITPMENVLAAAVLDHPFCLVGYDFGSDVVRDIVPNLKVTKPEAIVLLSGNGDAIIYSRRNQNLS